jgi:hypothetical protein
MTTLDEIKKICNSQPEGMELLNIIKVDFSHVEDQYHDCAYFQKLVAIKYDLEKLKSGGYSLREVLEESKGIVLADVEIFVLERLQKFIFARTPRVHPDQQQQETQPEQNNN